MKKKYAVIVVMMACAAAQSARGQIQSPISIPPNGNNQRAEISQWIGPVKIAVEYHSPNLHGGGGADRSGHIWGELVPYGLFDDGFGPTRDKPWRAGANETTTITFSHDVKVEGKDLKAGTYGLFLEPAKDGPWTWIFSSNWTGWGSYQYDAKNDVLRVPTTPQTAPHTEFMTFGFDERLPASAVGFVQWDEKRVPFKVEVPNATEIYVAQIRNELQGWAGFNYQNWQMAASFCASNKINLDEALVWAEKAIHEPFRGAAFGVEDFSTLETKAEVLQAMGRVAEADTTMDKAIVLPTADLMSVHFYGIRLLQAKRNDRALETFRANMKKHPEEKFWTYFGLARAYTALGDKGHAIQNWEIALRSVPDNRKGQIPAYEKTLKELKEGK